MYQTRFSVLGNSSKQNRWTSLPSWGWHSSEGRQSIWKNMKHYSVLISLTSATFQRLRGVAGTGVGDEDSIMWSEESAPLRKWHLSWDLQKVREWDMWYRKKHVPDRGNIVCKDPEAQTYLMCAKNRKDICTAEEWVMERERVPGEVRVCVRTLAHTLSEMRQG